MDIHYRVTGNRIITKLRQITNNKLDKRKIGVSEVK